MPVSPALPYDTSGAVPTVRKLSLDSLREALRGGWADFLAIPTQLVFLCILYPIIGLVAARAAFGEGLMPLVYPLISGFALVGPFLAIGIYELSRRREQGLPVSWLNAFDVLRSQQIVSIAMLGGALLVVFFVWIFAARAIYAGTIGGMIPASPTELWSMVMGTSAGWSLALVGNLVGGVFAVAVLVCTVIAFPMLLDRDVGPLVAVQTSIRVVLANPVVMAAWGAIVAGLLLLGCIPIFIGLAVVMPVLGHATWHLYRLAVVHAPGTG